MFNVLMIGCLQLQVCGLVMMRGEYGFVRSGENCFCFVLATTSKLTATVLLRNLMIRVQDLNTGSLAIVILVVSMSMSCAVYIAVTETKSCGMQALWRQLTMTKSTPFCGRVMVVNPTCCILSSEEHTQTS